MSVHAARALETSSSTSWLVHTVCRHLEQAYEVPAVVGIEELMVSFRGTARARRGLQPKLKGIGDQCSFTLSDYNQFYSGVDMHDTCGATTASGASAERVLPEDVLRWRRPCAVHQGACRGRRDTHSPPSWASQPAPARLLPVRVL